MRREKLVISTFICVFILLASCQQQAKMAEESAEAESKKTGPKIEFESVVYDFGKVGPRKKLNGEFKFTNTGDAPLKITKVEKCCGAVTELDKDKLAPGESGVLNVQYTSSRVASKIKKQLYVNSNDEGNPRVTLTIQAETVLKVTWEPKSLKLLLNEENAGCPDITLKSKENQPFSITKFESTGGFINADIDTSIEATEFVLQPKVDMEKLQGNLYGRINIGLAYPEPDTPPETAMIFFRVLSRFSVSPSALMFSYSNPQQPVKRYLLIANNYDEEFEIESTSSKEGRIKVLEQKKIRNGYRLALEITLKPVEDTKKFKDTFTINLKDGQTFEVNCRGTYKPAKLAKIERRTDPDVSVVTLKTAAAVEPNGPAPKITFENVVHDFGEVSGDKTSTAEFKFTNTGDAPLKITKVERCCGVVTKLDKTEYESGESGILKVTYTSSRMPNKMMRRLYVNSNDKETPRTALTIKAETVMKVDWEPKSLKLSLKADDAGCPEITLASLDNQPFSIKAFQSTSNAITADFDPSVEATRFVLRPKVDLERLQQGSSLGLIRIRLTHPECAVASISYAVKPKYKIAPRSLMVFDAESQKTVTRTLHVQSNYNEDFKVESVSSKNGFLRVLSQERILSGYRFEVEITPPSVEDTKRFVDAFTINLKGGEKLEIPCQGIYKTPTTTK